MGYMPIKMTILTLTKKHSTLFIIHIRPHLEYYVQAWSPYYAKDILVHEKVKYRAKKLVIGFKEFTYRVCGKINMTKTRRTEITRIFN